MQFLLPMVLVRCLDAATFGEYRLLWLAVGTVMALATLNMCGSLYYFLPRSDAAHEAALRPPDAALPRRRRAWSAALAGQPVEPAAAGGGAPARRIRAAGAGVRRAVGRRDAARLPADHRGAHRLAGAGPRSASRPLRAASLVGAGAWLTGELRVDPVAAARRGGAQAGAAARLRPALPRPRRGPGSSARAFAEQFAPRGAVRPLQRALRAARRRPTSGWRRACSRCPASPRSRSRRSSARWCSIFRHSVIEAFLPSMSRMQAAGDVRGMMEMNSRANVMVGTLLYPLLAFAFVFAEDIVTARLHRRLPRGGAGDARLHRRHGGAGGRGRQHRAAAAPGRLRAAASPRSRWSFSVAVSWIAAHHFGLAGAAAGSVLAIYFDRAVMLRRICARTPASRSRSCRTGAARLARSPSRRSARAPARGSLAERLLAGRRPVRAARRRRGGARRGLWPTLHAREKDAMRLAVRHRLAGARRRRAPHHHARQPPRRARPRVPLRYVKNDPSQLERLPRRGQRALPARAPLPRSRVASEALRTLTGAAEALGGGRGQPVRADVRLARAARLARRARRWP